MKLLRTAYLFLWGTKYHNDERMLFSLIAVLLASTLLGPTIIMILVAWFV